MSSNTKKSKQRNKAATAEVKKQAETSTQSVPYYMIYENGIIEIVKNRFSRTYKVEDVNFKLADREAQEMLANQYANFINSFEIGATVEVTIYKRTIDEEEFHQQVLCPMRNDDKNSYREEINNWLEDKMRDGNNNLTREIYLTIVINALDIQEATTKFDQVDINITDAMTGMIKSNAVPLTMIERLDLLHSIYVQNDTKSLYQQKEIDGVMVESFSLQQLALQGKSTKGLVVSDDLKFEDNKIITGKKIGRGFIVSNFPSRLKADLMTSIAKMPCNLLISTYLNVMPQDVAIKLVESKQNQMTGNILDIQKDSARKFIDSALISPKLQKARISAEQMLDDITRDDMFLATATIIINLFGRTEDELDALELQMETIVSRALVKTKCLTYQQEQAFNSALPLGNLQVDDDTLVTSKTIGAMMPFDAKEIKEGGGIYYGSHAKTNSMIFVNRREGMNPNAIILGKPGSGKSFFSKEEIINVLLSTDDYVYVLDPEREYTILAEHLGGSVITIANGANCHVNPFDLDLKNQDDEAGDPVKIKIAFITSMLNSAIGGKYGLDPIQESLIGRCVNQIYEPYLERLNVTGKTYDREYCPTWVDFYKCLMQQPQLEAQNLAISMEQFVTGAYDLFAHKTNVDMDNRFTVYDLKELKGNLSEIGLQICMENIWLKMLENYEKNDGRWTWIYIDEFHILMKTKTSAEYTEQLYKRARKWSGVPCAMTQNVEDMVNNSYARSVINNADFGILLAQADMNRAQVTKLFGLSAAEASYLNREKGIGIIKSGETYVPFINQFPKDTELYKIMSTKPDERLRR